VSSHDCSRCAKVLAVATAITACRGTEPPRLDAPRNVILVTIDTLRADRVGIDGGPRGLTPTLDELGRNGAVFLDATAHAPLTVPSHASILTGRYPTAHGVHDNAGFVLSDRVPTLATLLHAAGYKTAAFVSSFVLRGSTGFARGFDVYDDRFAGMGRAHLTVSSLERRAPETAREAARWVASAPRPFFLWVHFYDPHAPYDPPPAFAAKFPGRPYDSEVAAADFGVSLVVDALSPERRRDTVVVVTGDHGESLGEHGESEHGILLYDATLHVPLVMQGPGVPAGVTGRQQVRHVDIVPTVLGLLKVKAPAPLDGVNLLTPGAGTDRGRSGDRAGTERGRSGDGAGTERGQSGDGGGTDRGRMRTRPAELSYAESRFGELHFGWAPIRSVRDGAWKFIDGPDPELYDLKSDRDERDNRRPSREATATGLARALAEIASRGGAASTPATVDAETAQRLRSLGYIGGSMTLSGQAGADPKQEIANYEAYVKAFNDGLALLETDRPRNAETKFRALARSFPRAFEAHQYLGRALAARGAYDDAMREFDLAIALAPREATLYFDAARALASAGRFDAAFDRVATGLRAEPASFDGWMTCGLVSRAAGRHDAAEEAYREALKINPHLGIAHLELGRLAEARGRSEEARSEYRLALDLDSTLADARAALERIR
jgi:arylsulfatase A-like enzyme/Tfp pilus assembly protein PilF